MWTTQRFLIIVISLVSILTGALRTSAGAIFSRQDGSVELDVFGERAVLERNYIDQVYVDQNGSCENVSPRIYLRDWLHDAVTAACFDRTSPTGPSYEVSTGLNVYVRPKIENEIVIPGGILKSKLTDVLRLFIPLNLYFGPKIKNLQPKNIQNGEWKPAMLGYEMLYRGISSYDFRLPSSSRLGQTSRPLIVSCENATCSVVLRSDNDQLVVRLSWLPIPPFTESEPGAWPRSEWREYDYAARAMAASIFPFQPAGHMQ